MVLTDEGRDEIARMITAPYMKNATYSISIHRKFAGNQFRHQSATRTILIDYGHIDSVLHKAALNHDLIEDIEGFDHNLIINADSEGPQVYALILEVTKRPGEGKGEFLTRILETGSRNSKLLKCADRIDNMRDLGFVSDLHFIERYCNETEKYVVPMAIQVDTDMVTELKDLIQSRRNMLSMLRKIHSTPLGDEETFV